LKRFLKFILPCGVVDLVRNRRKLGDIGRRLSPTELFKSDRLVLDAEQSGSSLFAPGHVGRLRNVVDVGANTGQWSSMLLNCVTPRKLIIIEPLRHAFAALQKKFGNNGRVELHNVATGERESVETLKITRDTGAKQTLSKTKFLLVELNFMPQYDGGSWLGDLHEILTRDFGFFLANTSQPQVLNGHASMCDGLYVNPNLVREWVQA
jgi:hypothetical protein